jgi:hypothetical protein
MCEPATIAYAAVALVGAVSASQQQRAQGKFQKGTARFNARQAENEATQTRNKSVIEENKSRRSTSELVSRQRARLAASNVDVSSGSALQLQEDAALLGEVDALRIRSNLESKAVSLEDQAQLTLRSGEFAEQAGRNAATGTLLSAAGDIAGNEQVAGAVNSKWYSSDSAINDP